MAAFFQSDQRIAVFSNHLRQNQLSQLIMIRISLTLLFALIPAIAGAEPAAPATVPLGDRQLVIVSFDGAHDNAAGPEAYPGQRARQGRYGPLAPDLRCN